MSALAADTSRDLKTPGYLALPVKDGETLYHHALLCHDADGLLVPGANTAGLKFAGVGMQGVAVAADETCEVDAQSWYLATGSGFTAADVGKRVYLSDDRTVALTTTKRICCGVIAQYVSSTQVWVDPAGARGREMVTVISLGTLGAGLSDAQLAVLKAPVGQNVYLREVQVGITAITGTCTVDLKVAGTSVLDAVVTPSAGVVQGVIDTPSIAAAALITVHATTQASTGALTGTTVTLIWEVL